MKTIICGGRDHSDYTMLLRAIATCPWKITSVFSGKAPGADALGERWAMENGAAVTPFPANWGRYGRRAGPLRNAEMLEGGAEAVLALWNGLSTGTKDMIDKARRKGLRVHVVMQEVSHDADVVPPLYSASSRDVKAMKEEKEKLRAAGYPNQDVRQFLVRFCDIERYAAALQNRDPNYFVVPSTTRTNTIPREFARLLRDRFGGVIVTGWAVSENTLKAANKGGIGKLRDPVRYTATATALTRLPRSRLAVLVDDVVTTGETTDALRLLLADYGIHVGAVTAIGQAEARHVTPRDLERLATKLGAPSLLHEVTLVLHACLKHRANYIERVVTSGTIAEIREYFVREAEWRQPRLVHPSSPSRNAIKP